MKTSSIVFNVLIIIAVGILYYLHFKGKNNENTRTRSTIQKMTAGNIVFVNTDSIWDNYKFVEDKKKELDEYEQQLQKKYDDKLTSFKKEYDAYLKEGTSGKLTLTQQKKREEELAREQQEIGEYDKTLSSQFLELQHKLNDQIQDSIVSFIKKININSKYLYVLGYSKNSGILFADEKNDITNEILNGLNKEYQTK